MTDVDYGELKALEEEGVLLVTPERAAKALSRSEQTLRKYAKQRPDRLQRIPGGKRGVLYRWDQILEISRTGFI